MKISLSVYFENILHENHSESCGLHNLKMPLYMTSLGKMHTIGVRSVM